MTWIRFENHSRYHAVWLKLEEGAVHTWCDRRVAAFDHQSDNPRSRCSSCVRRIARPYLIPEKMKAMFRRSRGAA